MKCFFCKAHVNVKRQTTCYTFVPRKNGSLKKVRWCEPCNTIKPNEIDNFLKDCFSRLKMALQSASFEEKC